MTRYFLRLGLLGPLYLTACNETGGNPAFRRTGEVIAFSGGNGGPTSACATCHGLKGEGDGRLTPRLAGLDAGYLVRQLDDYANGRRRHVAMRTIARRLDSEDRVKVSAYYAALPAPASTLRTTSLYASKCASCHGGSGEGRGPGNPPLAGQSPTYVVVQIEAWRSGQRHDPTGTMLAVSRALAPAELAILASRDGDPSLPVRAPSTPAASR